MKITISAIATLVVMRIFIAIAANSPTLQFIFEDQSYHLYYGLALMFLAVFLRRRKYAYIFFGVGVGLFIDDVGALKYVMTGPAQTPIQEYWSPLFVIPLVVGLFALAISENRLKKIFPTYNSDENFRLSFKR